MHHLLRFKKQQPGIVAVLILLASSITSFGQLRDGINLPTSEQYSRQPRIEILLAFSERQLIENEDRQEVRNIERGDRAAVSRIVEFLIRGTAAGACLRSAESTTTVIDRLGPGVRHQVLQAALNRMIDFYLERVVVRVSRVLVPWRWDHVRVRNR